MSTSQETSLAAAAPAQRGLLAALEAALRARLLDRRLWLICACGLYVTLTLTLVQARTGGFDTMQLMARLLLVVETTLLLCACVLSSDLHGAGRVHSRPAERRAVAVSGGQTLILVLLLELLPLLLLHSYPALVEQGIRVPLMLLQKGLLLLLAVLSAYHLMLGGILQLRLPGWLACPLALFLYGWATLAFTRLTLASENFRRLNDLFYWNQLWVHAPAFPRLQTDYWTHNIEFSWLGWYLILGCGLATVTALLWLPAAWRLDTRETDLVKHRGH